MSRTGRFGVTIPELLVVGLVASILVRLVLPLYQHLTMKAQAASALGDIQAVRVAAYEYNSDTNQWPADHGAGMVPPELEPYLGAGFSFDRGLYRLDWENWELPDGSPQHADAEMMLGVSLTTPQPVFGGALRSLVGRAAAGYTLENHYTFLIAAL